MTMLGLGGLTLACYVMALWVFARCRNAVIVHPLVVTSVLIGGFLLWTDIPVERYQQDLAWLHWLLGPATVALALPLYNQLAHLRKDGRRVLVPIIAGGTIAPLLAVAGLWMCDVDGIYLRTMLTKSITTPLAMETALQVGGIPALAAVIVILTGIVGALAAGWIFRLSGVTGAKAQGAALGTVAHAVGTARALQLSETTGAYSTLALCLNGILTALLLPLLLWLLGF
ncbi:LrgB family protein [Aestuariibacter halophilus]|uniref:LrgB family protein n=1 Tax=Fluctibacter halophilus TaxID=226011 RepID=A0ABS8G7W2_9ALTE|nr:LrgB family protein [Aestuariibacter halophilus]MCC2616625.1 LrgB family protein [Aestuariibacter halophilus]